MWRFNLYFVAITFLGLCVDSVGVFDRVKSCGVPGKINKSILIVIKDIELSCLQLILREG